MELVFTLTQRFRGIILREEESLHQKRFVSRHDGAIRTLLPRSEKPVEPVLTLIPQFHDVTP